MKVFRRQLIVFGFALLCCWPLGAFAQVPKVHRHAGLRSSSLAEVLPDFSMPETVLEKRVKKTNLTVNKAGTLEAFTTDDEMRIFIRERKTGKIFEIKGLPFEWRWFSDLVWANNQTLMFDRWVEPHFANHYAVNGVTKKLLEAALFPDEFMFKLQTKKP